MRFKFKFTKYCLLLGLGLNLWLAACGEVATSAPVAVTPPGSTLKAATNLATTATAGPVAAVTSSPTRPPSVALPTATPAMLAATALSAAVVTPTDSDTMESGAIGQEAPRQPTLEELPRINGIVKIPLLNSDRPGPQAAPVVKANYGPNNTPRVGLQIGHYQIDQLPEEFASLRGQTGGSGGGVREVDVNQDIARRTAAILKAKGAEVDILPATVPPAYSADVFIAIHADAVTSANPSGYKLARSRFSAIPETDDKLLKILYASYGRATGLKTDSSITRNMTGYYAFNSRLRLNAITKITPAVIIETGFLTNAADRGVLLNRADAVAQGIADGVWEFLQSRPALVARERPITQVPAIEAKQENTPIYGENGRPLAYVSKGQRFEYFEERSGDFRVFVPVLRQAGYLHKSDVNPTFAPR